MTKFAIALLLLAIVPALDAQNAPMKPEVDISLGSGHGFGGDVHKRNLISASGLVAIPVRQFSRGALILAASASIDGVLSGTTFIDVPGTPGPRDFPGFYALGAIGGLAIRTGETTVARMLVGPAYMDYDSKEPTGHLGAVARADFAVRMAEHFSIVVWGQGAVPPVTRGERLGVASGGLGLRIR